jgi:hypothetical protein
MRKSKVVAKKSAKRSAKKSAPKAKRYNPQTGKPTGRTIGALERLDKLTAKYVAEGMSAPEAKAKAQAEMRDNNRRDWRA